jgi:hypothetical protein
MPRIRSTSVLIGGLLPLTLMVCAVGLDSGKASAGREPSEAKLASGGHSPEAALPTVSVAEWLLRSHERIVSSPTLVFAPEAAARFSSSSSVVARERGASPRPINLLLSVWLN